MANNLSIYLLPKNAERVSIYAEKKKRTEHMATNKVGGRTVQTVLDGLAYGEENSPYASGKVGKIRLPDGIDRRRIYMDVILIALPSLIELILTQLTSMADTVMVGRLSDIFTIGGEQINEGVIALSAVSLATQPKFLLMTMIQALNVGATAVIARFRGQNNREKANLVFKHAILLNLIMSVFFMVVGLVGSDWLIKLIAGNGIDQLTLDWGAQYLNIQLIGFVPLCLSITVTAALRGIGDTKTPMVYNTIANVVNLFFNYVMIYGHFGIPKMGVAGASWATVIGQTVAFFIAMVVAFGKKHYVYIDLKEKFKFDKALMGNVVSIGIPSMIEQLFMRAGMIIFTRQVTGLGETLYATHQVCMNIQSMSFMMGQAFANATTTLMGQSIGKRRYDMSAVYMRYTRNIGIGASFLLVAAMVFFGRGIVSLYNETPEIIHLGSQILLLLAASQPFQADQFIVSGGLRGAGDTRYTAVVTALTVLGLRSIICVTFISVFHFGLWGAWIALVADQCTRTALMAVRYHSGKWKNMKLKSTHVKA